MQERKILFRIALTRALYDNGTSVMPILRSRKTQFLLSSPFLDFITSFVRINHHLKDGNHPLLQFWSQNQSAPCLPNTSRLSGGDHSSYKSGQRTTGWPPDGKSVGWGFSGTCLTKSEIHEAKTRIAISLYAKGGRGVSRALGFQGCPKSLIFMIVFDFFCLNLFHENG